MIITNSWLHKSMCTVRVCRSPSKTEHLVFPAMFLPITVPKNCPLNINDGPQVGGLAYIFGDVVNIVPQV